MIRRPARQGVFKPLAAALAAGMLAVSHAPSACGPHPAGALAAPPSDPAPSDAPFVPLSSTSTPSMTTVRWHHSAVLLGDGRVLVVGGHPTQDSATSAEIFDPATGLWTRTAPMLTPHDWPVVAPTCDGRVFVGGALSAAREAEIYDPALDQWSSAGSTGKMKFRHTYGVATLLQDCRILITAGFGGGSPLNERSEVFDPATGLYTASGSMTMARFFPTATVLADGRVLVVGGGVDDNGTWYTWNTAEIWDPVAFTWTEVKALKRKRRAHTATLLPDGRVLVAGGTDGGKNDGTDGGTQLASAEIYDPAADAWTELEAKLVTPRGLHTAALLPSGAVMLFGGLDASGSASREVEIFHEGTWQRLEPHIGDRLFHASALLPGGAVLVAGGVHQATAELYVLGQPGDPCASGAECAGGVCADGVCCNEACGGGCRRCDVPGREGTCSVACADEVHVLGCPAGVASCEPVACAAVPCAPYRCDAEQGGCRTACTSVADCAPGYACDLDGACVPPPDVSGSDEACAVARPGPGGERGAPVFGALLVALGAVFSARSARSRARRPAGPGPRGCAAR